MALSRAFSAAAMHWDAAPGGELVVPELRGQVDVDVEVVAGGEAHGFVFWFDIGMVSSSSSSSSSSKSDHDSVVSTAPDAAAMRCLIASHTAPSSHVTPCDQGSPLAASVLLSPASTASTSVTAIVALAFIHSNSVACARFSSRDNSH